MWKILKNKLKKAEIEEISFFMFGCSILTICIALAMLILANCFSPSTQKVHKTTIDSNVPALVITK